MWLLQHSGAHFEEATLKTCYGVEAVEPRTLWLDHLIARTGPSKGTAAGGAWWDIVTGIRRRLVGHTSAGPRYWSLHGAAFLGEEIDPWVRVGSRATVPRSAGGPKRWRDEEAQANRR